MPEKCSMPVTSRSPTTMSARPSRIGRTSAGMSAAEYWLSASVFTTTSAPSFSAVSMPAWKPAARPLLLVRRTRWSTPSRARDGDGLVCRAVVDDQPLHDVEAGNLAGQVGRASAGTAPPR